MRHGVGALLLAAGLGAATARAERIPVVVNGDVTRDPMAVAALVVEDDGYLYGPFCSAVIVHASWALTAAHCVEAMQVDYGAYDTWLVTGSDLLQDGVEEAVPVDIALGHPDWDPSVYTDDIGVLHLEEPVAAEPVAVGTDAVHDGWLGADLRWVGFGVTTDGGDDQGVKRRADIPLVWYDAELLVGYDPDDGQNVCSGDSGGGVLKPEGSGWRLVGINAFVAVAEGGDPSRACAEGYGGATRVDVHLDWLASQTGLDTFEDTGGRDAGTRPFSREEGGCSAAPIRAPGAGLALAALAVLRRRAPRRPARSRG